MTKWIVTIVYSETDVCTFVYSGFYSGRMPLGHVTWLVAGRGRRSGSDIPIVKFARCADNLSKDEPGELFFNGIDFVLRQGDFALLHALSWKKWKHYINWFRCLVKEKQARTCNDIPRTRCCRYCRCRTCACASSRSIHTDCFLAAVSNKGNRF